MTWSKRTFLRLGLAAAVAPWLTPMGFAQGTNKKRLVILGDSITAGYGLAREDAYPALLQQKADAAGLAIEVVNAGVSGDTTAGGLRRVDWALGAKGADYLIVALGGNDGLRGVAPEQSQQNLIGIIHKARAKNPEMQILLAGMQMPENFGASFTEAFRAVFAKVAESENVALLPFLLEGVGGITHLNLPDRIHPNPEGQAIIANHVWAKLNETLLKP